MPRAILHKLSCVENVTGDKGEHGDQGANGIPGHTGRPGEQGMNIKFEAIIK